MAYNFNGVSQSITTGATVTAYPFTIAAWFNRNVSPSGTPLFLTTVDFSGGTQFHGIALDAGSNNVSARTNSGGSLDTAISTTTFTTNEWNHAAGVFDSSTSRIVYLNAGGASTGGTNLTPSSINNTTIGGRYASGSLGNFANALIAEVGIWNTSLTQPEIASLSKGMTCNLVRPQSLVFYAPLIRNLVDVKGGLTLTNNNTATVANHPRVYQ
jgi:hypothetical protein